MSKGSVECTRLDTPPIKSRHYEWKVTWRTPNFYKLCVGRIGQSIVSPVFKLKQNEALICVFPESLKANSHSNKRRISFSIYLHIIKRSKFPLKGTVTFDLAKPALPLGEVEITEESRIPNYGWGLQRSIYRKRFTSLAGWTGSTINCKISLAKRSFFKQPYWFKDATTTTDSPKLATDLGSLLENGYFYDVTFKIGEQELKAHKSILTVRSPVFAAMLNTNMLESTSNEINIVNVDLQVMQLLLEFIYTGKVGKDNTRPMPIGDLLVAADMYQVGDLKTMCGEILAANIDTENVVKYLYLAHKFSVGHLFRTAIHTIKFNWEVVSVSEEWKDLEKSNSDLAFFVHSTLDDDHYGGLPLNC